MKGKIRVSKAQVLCLALAVVMLAFMAAAYAFSREEKENDWMTAQRHTGGEGPIAEGRVVSQQFVSRADNLSRVSVMTSTARKTLGGGELILTLYGPDGDIINSVSVMESDIKDNQLAALELPVQEGSKGRTYTLEATAKGFSEGPAPYLRTGPIGEETGLSLSVDGEKRDGKTLYMKITTQSVVYHWELSFLFLVLAAAAATVYPLVPAGRKGEKGRD